jgi:hypothetical protein
MRSFSGEPSSDGFTKHYELHYQPKKVVVDGFEGFHLFSVINFHVRRGCEVGLTTAIKNKWSAGWMKTSAMAILSGLLNASEVGTLWKNSCLVVFGCWLPVASLNKQKSM